MNNTPTSAEIVRKATEEWNWTHKLQNPSEASGQCFISTDRVLNYYDNPKGLEVAFSQHYNDPNGRYMALGQYSNHYALWLPEEKLVVDLTLRQFAPTSAWPWVGTYSAWLRILARAWDVPSVKHLTRSRGVLCEGCAQVNCNPHDCIGFYPDC